MIYGLRMHDRHTEADPSLATVMYADGHDSPWYDMATGHPDHIEDILGALEWREAVRTIERAEEADRMWREVQEEERE